MAAILNTQVLYNDVLPPPNSLPDHSEIVTNQPSDLYEIVSKGYVDSKVNATYRTTSGFLVFSTRTGALANVTEASQVPYILTRTGEYCKLQIEGLLPVLATLSSDTIISGYPIPFALPEEIVTVPVVLYNNGAKIIGELSVDTFGYVRFKCPTLNPSYWRWYIGTSAGWMGCSITWGVNNVLPPPM